METEVVDIEQEMEDRNEIEYLEGLLSYCCDAPITETGFCEQCGEHAI